LTEHLKYASLKLANKLKEDIMLTRAILLPDLHHKHHNKLVWKVVLKFIKWFKPHKVILTGDAQNMDAVNHWKKDKGDLRSMEGKRLERDYELFIKEILIPIEKAVPRAEWIYMGGNHEQWAEDLVNQNPQLEGLVEPQHCLKLKERGWEWIPYTTVDKFGSFKRGHYDLGKLRVIHGHYTNKHHAAKTADMYAKSVAYCHTHDVQQFTKVTIDDPGYHTAQSIGCLCNLSPDYMKGNPNKWVHAFGVVTVREGGAYSLNVPIIIKGTFNYGKKLFSANK